MCINLGVPQTLRLRRFPIAYSQSGDGESCPDPYTLKMTCTVSRPTNWCLSDAECPSVNSIHPRKCCTTICGYNACLVKYNGKWMVG
nr:Whey acidic protein domain containing protein [Haemonchus contortus]